MAKNQNRAIVSILFKESNRNHPASAVISSRNSALHDSLESSSKLKKIANHEKFASLYVSPSTTLFKIMADKDSKNNGNVSGKFYVDSNCIDCDLCRENAPNNFARDEDEGVSIVNKQPTNDEELEQCQAAMEGCPVEAIGDDGE